MNRELSTAAFARAKKVIPGGVNSPARAFGAVGGEPIFIAKAEGPYLYDLDGNKYLDYIGSWGPMILGHAHPEVVAAATQAAARGSSYGAPCEAETELAELICELVPSIEMVRMVSSGTEAAMSAIRLARGATGRNVIVKFAGCYHGHVDALLVAAGSSALTHGVPSSPGVPAGCTADTVVLPYNCVTSLTELFAHRGAEIAGVMLEPVAGNMGLIQPTPEFRSALREITRTYGALLIYDEVMTGFRLSLAGAQGVYGDDPDITVLGKIVGGGYPVGAYGGKAHLMQQIMPAGKVFQAGTLSGNPVAMAAGLTTLKILRDSPPYERLNQLGAKLEEGIRQAAANIGVPYQFNRIGSMWTLFFTETPVVDLVTAQTSDTKKFGAFFWEMMNRGIYLPCSQFEAAFNSTMHDDAEIAGTIKAVRESFRALSRR
ncbi:MAG: glutamate-1-semialdehyde 2,1-aminomutase [Zavarzinella sp.]